MNEFDEVKGSMKSVEKSLLDQLERRERVLKESRDVIASCSRAIINIHNQKVSDASKELSKAKSLLVDLKKAGHGSVSRYLISPETEFVEGSVVFALVKGKKIPSRDSLECSSEAYVLGLLDSVGELKRLVLDSVMRNKLPQAEKYFRSMEELYALCSPLAVYDHVVNGVRRKIDVARMLVEDTRGLLAQEKGREELVSSMDRLYRKLAR